MKQLLLYLSIFSFSLHSKDLVKGYSLTELGEHRYDALDDPKATVGKTGAQVIVDKLYDLGVRQINLSPRAKMTDPWKTELIAMTKPEDRADERKRYLRLIRYIKSKGMQVGIRPIFFVVDQAGKTPYVQEFPANITQKLAMVVSTLQKILENPSKKVDHLAFASEVVTKLIESESAKKAPNEEWLVRRLKLVKIQLDKTLPELKDADLKNEISRLVAKINMIGSKKDWWHGNIEPTDPFKWFESYKTYLDMYLPIAKLAKVEEFTLAAELYTMTVGIEDRWEEQPHGFPKQWLDLLNYVKTKLHKECRVMYDINFTDDKIEAGGLEQYGGEFARWKYRLVDLADKKEHKEIWQALVDFWKGLDAIGIDMYRSLASDKQKLPQEYEALTALLKQTTDRFANQIDNALFEIENTPGIEIKKDVILKELGFRSVTNSFINPFVYAGETGEVNLEHQGAAYQAVFQSFWGEKWDWFKGIVFWDASVDISKHGDRDISFSPIGKPPTERALKDFFKP